MVAMFDLELELCNISYVVSTIIRAFTFHQKIFVIEDTT